MSTTLKRLASGLERLRRADPDGHLAFGASAHRYVLNVPLTEPEVVAFESKHRIVLPADYREFLLTIGNGGAGPFYGLFRLGEMDEGFEQAAWEPGSLVGDPSAPFPHVESWNLSQAELDELQDGEDQDAILQRYWVPVNGALPLCHEGCALRDWLVVTGPETGHVWHDATAEYGGWRPVLDGQGARATFESWYDEWLEAVLGELRG